MSPDCVSLRSEDSIVRLHRSYS